MAASVLSVRKQWVREQGISCTEKQPHDGRHFSSNHFKPRAAFNIFHYNRKSHWLTEKPVKALLFLRGPTTGAAEPGSWQGSQTLSSALRGALRIRDGQQADKWSRLHNEEEGKLLAGRIFLRKCSSSCICWRVFSP